MNEYVRHFVKVQPLNKLHDYTLQRHRDRGKGIVKIIGRWFTCIMHLVVVPNYEHVANFMLYKYANTRNTILTF